MSLPIGFFSPLPLPIMVPFMFMQSAAMALGFGSFFQYGKRKISSMSNEEFNVLTPEALTSQLISSIDNMIPSVESSFHQMEKMNEMILQAMAKYFDQAVGFLDRWITQRGQNFVQNVQEGIIDPVQGAADDVTSQIQDFYIEQISTETGPGRAGGVDSDYAQETPQVQTKKYNAIEQYASQWMNPATGIGNYKTMTQKIGLYLLKQMRDGNMPSFTIFRAGLVRYVDSLNPKKLTPKEEDLRVRQVIGTVTVQGTFVENVATLWQSMKFHLDRTNKRQSVSTRYKATNKFLAIAKGYNRYVQGKGKPKLAVDTRKSLASGKLTPKSSR